MNRKHRRQRSHRAATHRPRLELLEDRCLPSATFTHLFTHPSDHPPDAGLRDLTAVGQTLYFVGDPNADDPNGGEIQVLYKSDGTTEGTLPLKAVRMPLGGTWGSALTHSAVVNGTLYFVANDPLLGIELWKTDGTTAGTTVAIDLNDGAGNSFSPDEPPFLTEMNGALFFVSGSAFNKGLWTTDGTPGGTTKLRAGAASGLTNVNGTLFFSAYDETHGQELWKTDGTPAGTVLVKDVFPGTDALGAPNGTALAEFAAFGGLLYFTADDGIHGRELWRSDGSEAGTTLVRDIYPGAAPSGFLNYTLTAVNDTLFFFAEDGVYGRELWLTDGTAAGTTLVKDVRPGPMGSDAYGFTIAAFGDTLFFVANDGDTGWELWRSDGAEAGTVMVLDIDPGPASGDPRSLTNFNGTLYFSAGGFWGPLWQSDGTAAGTTVVRDSVTGEIFGQPHSLTPMNGALFFSMSNRAELWKLVPDAAETPPMLKPSGLPAVTVTEDAAATVLELRDYFDDLQDGAAGLTYTVHHNTNPALFSAVTIDDASDRLTLAPAPHAHGTANLTIRATDRGGLFVEAILTVIVTAPSRSTADLAVTLSASPQFVTAGTPVTYTGTIMNRGPDAAADVSFFQELPREVTFVSATASQGVAQFDASAGGVRGELGMMPFGLSATVTIVVRPNQTGSLISTANVRNLDAAAVDLNPLNDRASLLTKVAKGKADLAVTLVDSSDPAVVGGLLTYTATVTNLGASVADVVILNQVLPVQMTYVSSRSSQGASPVFTGSSGPQTDEVTANLGMLAPGEIATVTIVGTPTRPGTLVSTVKVLNRVGPSKNEAPVSDPDSANNVARQETVVYPVGVSDLSVTLMASSDRVVVGELLTYTATVTNVGPFHANGANLTLSGLRNVSVVSINSSQGTASARKGKDIEVDLGAIASGASATVTFVVRSDSPRILHTTATIRNFRDGPAPGVATQRTGVYLPGTWDLAVTLVDSPYAVVGQLLSYTATVTNLGPSDAERVTLKQVLPLGVTYVSATSSQGINSVVNFGKGIADEVTANLGMLAVGGSATVTVLVKPTRPGVLTSTVTVSNQFSGRKGVVADADPGNNSDRLQTFVYALGTSDLSVTLVSSPDPVVVGQLLTYTLTVTNSGPFQADRANLTLEGLRDVTVVSVNSSQGTARAEKFDYIFADLGTLASGASATVTIVVRPSRSGILRATATVRNASRDGPPPGEATQETVVQIALD